MSTHTHDHETTSHHCTGHHHHHHSGEGNILLAFLLNLFFSIVELVGGTLTGSVAILTDALHDLGDALALGLAWYLERLSKGKRDANFSYGYKRFSLLSALVISTILLVGSIFVIKASIARIIEPEEPSATGMLWLAIFGLVINGYAAYRLSKGESLNQRAVRLHMMEDVLGWVAVLIVSVIMHFVHLPILDPLLSLGITAWILYNIYFNLRDTFRILLQGIPVGVDSTAFSQDILTIEGILHVHDLHIWTLNGEDHIASLHIVATAEAIASAQDISQLKAHIRRIADQHSLHHITIEIDPEGCSCGMEGC